MKKIEEMTIEELRTRAAEIRTAAADTTLEQDALSELEQEADAIAKRIAQYDAEQRRRALAEKMTATGEPVRVPRCRPGRGRDPRQGLYRDPQPRPSPPVKSVPP